MEHWDNRAFEELVREAGDDLAELSRLQRLAQRRLNNLIVFTETWLPEGVVNSLEAQMIARTVQVPRMRSILELIRDKINNLNNSQVEG